MADLPPIDRRRIATPPALDQRVSFIVHRINAKLAQVCNPVFRQHDLDLDSSRILVALLERKEVRVGELVDLMVLPQSTISHQLQRLEALGLLKRRRTLADNRSVAVSLTVRGRRIAKECNDLSAVVLSAMFAGLEACDIETVQRMLGRMLHNLDAPELPTDAAEMLNSVSEEPSPKPHPRRRVATSIAAAGAPPLAKSRGG